MPETPDFEEWARQVYAAIVLMQGDPTLMDMSERVARRGLVELLRRIWNARGAADLAQLDQLVPGASSKVIDQAIRSLDR